MEPSLRIVHVVSSLGAGGIERLVTDLARCQLKGGHRVLVVARHADGVFRQRLVEAGIEVITDGCSKARWWPRPWRVLGAVRKAIDFVDIWHFHTTNVPVLICSAFMGHARVFTDHGTHGFGAKSRAKLRVRTFGFVFLGRLLAVRWVGIHESFRMQTAQFLGVDPGRVHVVPNGVSAEFSGSQDSSALRPLRVLIASRLVPHKRVSLGIQAYCDAALGAAGELRICGDGPERLALELQARKDGSREEVTFLGTVSNMPDHYSWADIVIFPTGWEPFGLITIEAIMAQRPVLVMADSGTPAAILSDICPKWVCSSRGELAERLRELGKGSQGGLGIARKEAARAAAFAKGHYSLETMVASYEKVYRAGIR